MTDATTPMIIVGGDRGPRPPVPSRIRAPRRRPARGAQPAAARGRHLPRPGAAHRRGRRLGQDERAHAPHREPAAHERGLAEPDPRDHVHEQGRGRDARARRAARSATARRACGSRRSTPRACASCAARPSSSGSRSRSRSTTPATRARCIKRLVKEHEADAYGLTPAGDAEPHLEAQERAGGCRVLRPVGEHERPGRARVRRGVRRLPARAAARERLRLRRPHRADGLPVPGVPARRRRLPPPVPAHPGRRVPGHQPRPVRADPRADPADRLRRRSRSRRPAA